MSRGADAGLTLIETLIVLAIIAVVSGATLLTLSPHLDSASEVEARLLATNVQTAVDRSIVGDTHEMLTVDDAGYRLSTGAYHALPAGMTITGAPARAMPIGFDRGVPLTLVVGRGDTRWEMKYDGLRAIAAPAARAS